MKRFHQYQVILSNTFIFPNPEPPANSILYGWLEICSQPKLSSSLKLIIVFSFYLWIFTLQVLYHNMDMKSINQKKSI